MRQGLSLRMSQHLALTPQLQQSIRLLQLSTLELNQEIGQMLDDNPFLEVETDDPLPGGDPPVGSAEPDPGRVEADADTGLDEAAVDRGADLPSWDAEAAPDNGMLDGVGPAGDGWGDDAAPGRGGGGPSDDDELQAADLASAHVTLADHLHRQTLALRLCDEDRAALRFLIESLNPDGWLADGIDALVEQLAGADAEAADELRHRFTVALRLLQSLDPPGVGARSLAECLQLQIRGLDEDEDDADTRALALRLCALPLELLARRDLRRLAQLTGATESSLRGALALIARLDPKPGRRFADVGDAHYHANARHFLLFLISEEPLYHALQRHSFRVWIGRVSERRRPFCPADFGLDATAAPLIAALDALLTALEATPTHGELSKVIDDLQSRIVNAEHLRQSLFGRCEGLARERLRAAELTPYLDATIERLHAYLGIEHIEASGM